MNGARDFGGEAETSLCPSPPGSAPVFASLNCSVTDAYPGALQGTWRCCNKVIARLGNICDINELLWSVLSGIQAGCVALKTKHEQKQLENSDIAVVLKWVKERVTYLADADKK